MIQAEVKLVWVDGDGKEIPENFLVEEYKKAQKENDEPGMRLLSGMLKELGVFAHYPELVL